MLKSISRTADKCVSFARDDFSKSLVQVLVATETDIGAFSALLKVEVDSIEDPNTIFRGNTMATKTIDQVTNFSYYIIYV